MLSLRWGIVGGALRVISFYSRRTRITPSNVAPQGEIAMFTRRLDLNGFLKEVEEAKDAPKMDEGLQDL